MITVQLNAIICRLPNRKVIIFKEPNLITLECYRLQQITEELIEKTSKNSDYHRVIRLKNKTLLYTVKRIAFFPDMFELIAGAYFSLSEIQNYENI